jgi:hypothetical protein
VFSEKPEVAQLGDRRPRVVQRQDVLFVVPGRVERDVDLAHLKAADAKVDFGTDLQNIGELQFQRVSVPARLFAQPIERQAKQSHLAFVEIRDGHRRDFGQTDLAGRKNQAPTRDDAHVRTWNGLGGEFTPAKIVAPVFVDPTHGRLHV